MKLAFDPIAVQYGIFVNGMSIHGFNTSEKLDQRATPNI